MVITNSLQPSGRVYYIMCNILLIYIVLSKLVILIKRGAP